MKRIIWILVLAALGWYAWGKYEDHARAQRAAEAAARSPRKVGGIPAKAGAPDVSFFTCDGRNACTQMRSCEEAKYFVRNCGINNGASGEGAPSCESQWCKK